jgi:hypothetical protein
MRIVFMWLVKTIHYQFVLFISYSQGQLVVIKEGLKEGDKIITSDLVPVIEGIKLELIESDAFQKEIAALALGTK